MPSFTGRQFRAFTSTSQNRVEAEQFGNVLFVIAIDSRYSQDVSNFPLYDEEEMLLDS